MKKVHRSKIRHGRVSSKLNFGSFGETALRVRMRWLFVTCVALVCLGIFAARNGAEQVDSGWAVSVPSPLATGPTNNPEQELVIRHVLEQTQQPLLRKPTSGSASSVTNGHTEAGLRFAVRPEASSVDGWRPAAGPSIIPNGENWTFRATAPQAGPSSAPSKRNYEAECDCSGMNSAAASVAGARKAVAARLPPASEPSLPQLPAPATIDQAPANTSIEEATSDGAPDSTPAGSSATTTVESGDSQLKVVPAETAPAKEAAAQPQAAASVPSTPAPAASATASSAPTAKAPATDVTPITEMPPLSRQLLSLKSRVRTVLKGYYRKALNSKENDPWESMHGMLAYGVNSRIHDGGPNGQLITSVGWLCYNKPCKGQTLLYVTPAGELRAKYGVGLQGHLGQFLAMLAQCHISPDYPIHVGDHEFTVKDLIEAEKKTCYPKSELTFKLIALQHYADLNDTWVNDQGVDWDFPRLVREELAQPIRGAACGGTHRLSGLSLVVKTRLRRGEPLDGEYKRADEFVKKYQMYAFRLQNKDGSLSTSWFRGSGDEDDINRRIKTTGHILEWLCYSLSDEQLREPQTVRAVTYLANLMYSNYDNEWEIGPRSHATHALLLYDQRVFQPYDKEGEIATYRPSPTVAKRNTSGGGAIGR
jgi:hypothetical protein